MNRAALACSLLLLASVTAYADPSPPPGQNPPPPEDGDRVTTFDDGSSLVERPDGTHTGVKPEILDGNDRWDAYRPSQNIENRRGEVADPDELRAVQDRHNQEKVDGSLEQYGDHWNRGNVSPDQTLNPGQQQEALDRAGNIMDPKDDDWNARYSQGSTDVLARDNANRTQTFDDGSTVTRRGAGDETRYESTPSPEYEPQVFDDGSTLQHTPDGSYYSTGASEDSGGE